MAGSIPCIPLVAELVLSFTVVSPPAGDPDTPPIEDSAAPPVQGATMAPALPPEPEDPTLEVAPVPAPPPPAPAAAPVPQATDDESAPSAAEWREPTPEAERTVVSGGTRRWFSSVYIGGTRPIRNAEYDGISPGPTSNLALEEGLGAHLNDSSDGPSLGIVLQQAFGEAVNTYVFAPRFEYDAKLSQRYALYATPSLAVGYKLIDPGGLESTDCPSYDTCDPVERAHQAWFQLGFGIKVILGDRLLLAFRPVALEVTGLHAATKQADARDDPPILALRWNLSGGFGLTF